jgi:hypothetical protein
MYFSLLKKNKHFYLVEEEKFKKCEFEVIVKHIQWNSENALI